MCSLINLMTGDWLGRGCSTHQFSGPTHLIFIILLFTTKQSSNAEISLLSTRSKCIISDICGFICELLGILSLFYKFSISFCGREDHRVVGDYAKDTRKAEESCTRSFGPTASITSVLPHIVHG